MTYQMILTKTVYLHEPHSLITEIKLKHGSAIADFWKNIIK